MSSQTQLVGGSFQDAEGNLLVNGYLTLTLNQDSVVNTSQICAGINIRIQLDSVGNVASSSSTPPAPNQFVWSNSVLTPINSFYRITGYSASGQISWGPNNCQITGNGGTFDMGTITPNTVFSWQPSVQGVTLKTNGVLNSTQTILNLAGTGITESGGTVTFPSSSGSPTGVAVFPRIPFISTAQTVSGANKSLIFALPAGSIAAFTGKFTLTLQNNTHALILGNTIIKRTLPNDTVIIDSTPITFGGITTPTLAIGQHTSDVINYIADADHDYYIVLYLDPSNTGIVNGAVVGDVRGCGGADFGDSTGNTITSLQSTASSNEWFAIVGLHTA